MTETRKEAGWDVVTDPANPQPLIWPVCEDCGDNYEYRSAWSMTSGKTIWAWFRPPPIRGGCKHKGGMVKNTEYRYGVS